MKRAVSKETVVLRRWGSSIQKFGFINGARVSILDSGVLYDSLETLSDCQGGLLFPSSSD